MVGQPTWQWACEFLAQLPETEFDPGRLVFPSGVVRVRGKVVAYPAGGDRGRPPDAKPTEEFIFIKTTPDEREALLHEDPVTFFVTPHYAGAPGVVRLSTVDEGHLRELLIDAWHLDDRQIGVGRRLADSFDEYRVATCQRLQPFSLTRPSRNDSRRCPRVSSPRVVAAAGAAPVNGLVNEAIRKIVEPDGRPARSLSARPAPAT